MSIAHLITITASVATIFANLASMCFSISSARFSSGVRAEREAGAMWYAWGWVCVVVGVIGVIAGVAYGSCFREANP